jgi:hypothetical protein
MNYNLPKINEDYPQFGVINGQDKADPDEVQVDLDEQRRQLKKRVEAEEFWAGRNLAARISSRRAA